MSTWMTYLPAGFSTAPFRSTDSMVTAVAEGSCIAHFGDARYAMDVHDVAAQPGWTWRRFEAKEDCFLFCFSDRVVHEKLGFFREERGRA